MANKLPTIPEQEEPKDLIKSSSDKLNSGTTSADKSSENKLKVNGNNKAVPKRNSSSINHIQKPSITLTEDHFGIYYSHDGKQTKIQRFTWKNANKVQVQVISYGAIITSIKVPDKKGILDDIVLGFSNLEGYLHYGNYNFGATIGRVTNKIRDSTFEIDGQEYKVSSNLENHHTNGGFRGLQRTIWNAYVVDSKVVLTCVLPDKSEGFPGTLMVKITYELLANNEFRINMEANTTKPTIINLSNICYFNLGGHHSGAKEVYNHLISINANCYTLMDEDDFPTGEIMNVVSTKYDFCSSPVLLKNILDVGPDDKFEQNLCVNRATGQGNCFIARAVHVTNGRVLEIYSNQYGVCFDTANNFGIGLPVNHKSNSHQFFEDEEGVFPLLAQLYDTMLGIEQFNPTNFKYVHDLVKKIKRAMDEEEMIESGDVPFVNVDFGLTEMMETLTKSVTYIRNVIPDNLDDIENWDQLRLVVYNLLETLHQLDAADNWSRLSGKSSAVEYFELEELLGRIGRQTSSESNSPSQILQSFRYKMAADKRSVSANSDDGEQKPANIIPSTYNDGRIHGKNNAIYKCHGGIAFQTQNYPDAIHHDNFPSPILRPGETYRHSIVYRFYVKDESLNKIKIIRKKC